MKYICAILAFLLIGTIAVAGGFDKVSMKISNVSTSATPDQSTSGETTGYIERIVIRVGPSTNGIEMDLDVIASNSYTRAETTLYSANDVGTNVDVYPRLVTHTTAGVAVTNWGNRIPVHQDNIIFKAGASSNVDCTATAIIYYQDQR